MRVLLIEDDPMIGKSLSLALGREGFTVDWVHDGDDGADALASGDHAVVLLDIGLPKRSGLSILKSARANRNSAAVDQSREQQQWLNKVPEVTAYFWIIKVLSTTVGETAADLLSTHLNLGLTVNLR